jgi:hypothetical protein
MVLMFLLIVKVDDLRANYSGSTVALADICLKPLSTDCATQSVLQVMILQYLQYSFCIETNLVSQEYTNVLYSILCLIWFIQTTIEVIVSMLNAAVFPAGS